MQLKLGESEYLAEAIYIYEYMEKAQTTLEALCLHTMNFLGPKVPGQMIGTVYPLEVF